MPRLRWKSGVLTIGSLLFLLDNNVFLLALSCFYMTHHPGHGSPTLALLWDFLTWDEEKLSGKFISGEKGYHKEIWTRKVEPACAMKENETTRRENQRQKAETKAWP